ncbi:MAG: 30S ribosomal protein S9 [Candidatus Daviesbacteria bacterium GW2011_GWA2_38_24]|uniref:30S ribosomal protein S9 n=1 Tax=Candidatus Daviesbacteria bacterium GW2011_GWA2_38_24 TaxID=1618422 RepID=A0A0G0MR39_9BACT|nr:MAG: 30S ribosomal protein S9 [Candidatus Daviesbacteria bacterium GW2011_GWA2_38_24]KKQ78355.1 MAG: 30S ribosomal protein S9 [Candidatus Daviesbacteria bacterium GW2011_GWA1_38_7]OGE24507.1 MAG: 30S ribosomal protein S9 [Candidatus Daviesbacteria bacterium RIFCSPHIGHO2_01_FULL_38_8]
MNKASYYQAVGRRKEAVARVRLLKGVGQMTVNGKPISTYFPGPIFQKSYQRPFEVTQTLGQFTGSVKVEGGGVSSQLDAVVHGIARALEKVSRDQFRPSLKTAGLLTRDPRAKERRKFGQAGKARAKKQSPKR